MLVRVIHQKVAKLDSNHKANEPEEVGPHHGRAVQFGYPGRLDLTHSILLLPLNIIVLIDKILNVVKTLPCIKEPKGREKFCVIGC